MLMEEENVFSSLPDVPDSVLQQPQQDPLISLDHQYVNGEQQTNVWGESEVQINQVHGTDELSLSSKAGQDTTEEAEQWEQVIWSVRPLSCASPPLSFATVQWDMPDPATETPSLITDSSVANELDSDGVMTVDTISSSPLHQSQDINAELFTQEVWEEEDRFHSQPLNSNLEGTGNDSEPCDAADVQEPTAQEEEDSTHELLDNNNEIPLTTESEEEEEQSATAGLVETVDLIDILEDTEGSEDEAKSLVDLNQEEEQDEPGALLTLRGNSEEEQTSLNGVEIEEENEKEGEAEEEQTVTDLCCTEESEDAKSVSSVTDVEVPVEQLLPDNSEPAVNPDKLTELPQSELVGEKTNSGSEEDIEILEGLHEDPTGQSEEPEMCKNIDQNLDPQDSEAMCDNEDPSIQMADNVERIENSQETLELTGKLEETNCPQHQDCDQPTSQELLPELEHPESEQLEMTSIQEQIQAEVQAQEQQSEDQLGKAQHAEQSLQMELTEESAQSENAGECTLSEQAVCPEDEDPGVAEQQQQTEPSEQNEQTAVSSQSTLSEQLVRPEEADVSEITEQLSAETELTQQTAEAEFSQVDEQPETSHQNAGSEDGSVQTVVANGEQPKLPETAVTLMNGGAVDREMARRLAEQLYKLDGIQRVDVVKHLDKDNDFSRAVGEEYLKFFDFTGQTVDHALRSFLKVVVLIGETQERERVLQHFACHFHQCNPDSFSSSGSVLALTCAVMLLNTDLHGQNVGKSMSSSKFVSNLDGMNEGGNFSKDLLKSLYNSIKSEPLEWAVDEEELKTSVLVDEHAADDVPLRSKANPFLNVPHDKRATVVKEGFLRRKLHADIDGKRTPWGKRGWKTFYGVFRGMVLYLQKNDYRRDQPTNEEVVSVHHSLAEQAADYTKKPHVFRLQTADWRVFLFQASNISCRRIQEC
uniref:PH and SEC7 domain-containing protein 4 isoform X2 n=1 Tax=Scatophagus argus TaxID=75038 RepID=UPI001ED81068|nr:PH and SEC7 domain-containing protein 4 isoform X2 [Scatophagus argus]